MIGFGRNRRVMMVGGEGVVLYSPSGKGGMERENSISWDVPNFEEQLAETLSERSGSKSLVILFDGADQTYRREENIPKLSPIDRPRFVKRKLELAFPSYPIRASMEVKAGKKKKGLAGLGQKTSAPSYLFVALPETEQVDRVSAAVLEAGVSVAGFGLLPTEASALVSEMSEKVFGIKGARKSRWALLVGQHETGGLRQVVVKDGNLALTRLTPTSDAGTGGPGWVEDAVREFKATMTYISRFGYTPEDGLDVMIICGDIEKEFFSGRDMGVTHFKCINPSEALRHLGMKSYGLEKSNFADVVHAAWVSKTKSLRLPVRVPSLHRIHAPRLAANLGAVALALGALGLLGVSAQALLSYSSTQSEITSREIHATALEREYVDEAKAFDGLPIDPAVVRSAMAVKDLLEINTVDISPVLHRIKNVIGGDIVLEEMSFTHTPSAKLLATGGSATRGGLFGNFGVNKDDEAGKVKVSFSFTLPDLLPLEQKVIRAEGMMGALKAAFPDYSVILVQQFSGMARDGTMRGEAGQLGGGAAGQPARDLAKFELEGAPLK